jgi:tetratricopeptide (TPR) repeat protein
MKQLFTLLLVLGFVSAAISQTTVTKPQLDELVKRYQQGEKEATLKEIAAYRAGVSPKDSMYYLVVMTSSEMNMGVYHLKQAVKDQETLVKLKPEKEVEYQNNIVRCKIYLGDLDGIIKASNRIIQLDPKHKYAYTNLAMAYNLFDKPADALKTLKANPGETRPTGQLQYAIAYYNLNKLDSAQVYIDKYLATPASKENLVAYKYAALIYSKRGDEGSSCKYITTAQQLVATNKEMEIFKDKTYWMGTHLKKEATEIEALAGKLCK